MYVVCAWRHGQVPAVIAAYKTPYILDAYAGGERGWDVYRFEYRLTGPLTAVFTSGPGGAMDKYHRIHQLLWRLKRVEHALAHAWSVLKTQAERLLPRLGRGELTAPIAEHFISSSAVCSGRGSRWLCCYGGTYAGACVERAQNAGGAAPVFEHCCVQSEPGSVWIWCYIPDPNSYLSSPTGRGPAEDTLRRCLALRHRLSHFATSLQYYIQFEVLEAAWGRFAAAAAAAKDLDQLIAAHDEYQARSMHVMHCLHRTPSDKLLSASCLDCVVVRRRKHCVVDASFALSPDAGTAAARSMHLFLVVLCMKNSQ